MNYPHNKANNIIGAGSIVGGYRSPLCGPDDLQDAEAARKAREEQAAIDAEVNEKIKVAYREHEEETIKPDNSWKIDEMEKNMFVVNKLLRTCMIENVKLKRELNAVRSTLEHLEEEEKADKKGRD